MTKAIFFIVLQFFILLLNANNKNDIFFETQKIDAGYISEGPHHKFVFVFKNTGKDTLKVNVKSSCGCLTPNWPRRLILPNESDTVLGIYNTQGRPGPFTKTLTLSYETQKQRVDTLYVLYLSGFVVSYPGINISPILGLDSVNYDKWGFHINKKDTGLIVLRLMNNDSLDLNVYVENYNINLKEFQTSFINENSSIDFKLTPTFLKKLVGQFFLKPKEETCLILHIKEKGKYGTEEFVLRANEYFFRLKVDR